MELVGTMPTYRDLFPRVGRVGEKQIIKILKKLYFRDCLFILAKQSRHYFKYIQMNYGQHDGNQLYRERCFELLDETTIQKILEAERKNRKKYNNIFPELSILHLIKLCLRYCDKSNYTKTEQFPVDVLHCIGKCLLITNSVMADWQLKNVSNDEKNSMELIVNFTKQMIADKNYHVLQKLYQNYYIFNYLKKYKKDFDIEAIFIKRYKVNVFEYSAFLFLLFSQFVVKNTPTEDWEMPHLSLERALENVRQKFKNELLENLIINNINAKKIDRSFFNATDITKRPLVKFDDNIIIPLSLRRLFSGLTDSVYFDILDHIQEKKQKGEYSKFFGKAVEDYFRDIALHIDPGVIFEFEYGQSNIKTPDAMMLQKESVIFFECKKRPFHNLQFMQNGNKEIFLDRIHEFYRIPLEQVCNRIKDFRSEKFKLVGVDKNALIYPVIVCPLAPPILSGGWDKFNLDEYVLPDLYKDEKNIAPPEFIDFAELECIEEYLRVNTDISFTDLIKIKREDASHHNSNWIVILQKNNMALQNKRLAEKFLKEAKNFKNILF